MKEYIHFDGEKDVTFNIESIDYDKDIVVIATTNLGKISIMEYEIKYDKYGSYFEYGHFYERIYLHDFIELWKNLLLQNHIKPLPFHNN